ncbi:UNVERIFIED_CONTAM: Protection of telomeres protein 1a [Sesamum calycinum]|uniref:Protection of telomeres protein 1a n=1 Tax=Sesamum calycinum TaxID=2727403 RepID=A0AAW2SYG7_9LAMI
MGREDYKFMQLVDAIACINQRVNLIGIVVETSLPKSTKGTDYFCSVKIIDESRPSLGIYINFFAETMEKLPHVGSVGDVIMVSHVVVKIRGSEVYALFNKAFSSFALFEGRDHSGKELVPYQISSRYKARDQDKNFIMGLRKWSMQHKIEGLNESLQLREIKEGGHLNLLCKVLHISEVKENDWMLLFGMEQTHPLLLLKPIDIWDQHISFMVLLLLEDEMENPLPLQVEPSPVSRDVLCTLPPVGTILRMIVDQGNEKIGIKFLKTNKWVKLINVKCEVRAALWHAVLMPFSKLCYLPDDDHSVIERQRSYNERIQSKWGRMPFTSFPWPSHITETEHPDVPFVTLMNILSHPEVTCKFKSVVRVVAIFPWRAEDFLSPSGIYRVRLTLEDPTARVHAFLYAEDGVRGGSAGVIESLYGVIKPIPIVKKAVDIRSSGKIGSGTTEIPFSVILKDPKEENLEKFYETFHGGNVSIQYLVTVDVVRGYLHKPLSTTVEFIVESEKDNLPQKPVSPEMVIFYITQDTQRHTLLTELKSGGFRVTGKVCTQCSLLDPIGGELTVEASAVPIESIDIHLIRVESILIG